LGNICSVFVKLCFRPKIINVNYQAEYTIFQETDFGLPQTTYFIKMKTPLCVQVLDFGDEREKREDIGSIGGAKILTTRPVQEIVQESFMRGFKHSGFNIVTQGEKISLFRETFCN